MVNHGYDLYETTKFSDFRDMVEQAARRYPDRTALAYKEDPRDEKTIEKTYLQCRDIVRDLGTALISSGLRDKHVAIISDACYQWVLSYFALMSIGAVVVPIDRDLPVDDMADILVEGECSCILYSKSVESKIEALVPKIMQLDDILCFDEPAIARATAWDKLVEKGRKLHLSGDNSYYDYVIDAERLATIVFTSGTTGQGKGVMLSQKNICLDMTNGMYLFDITPKTINFLPPHHTFASTVVFVGHYSQGSTIYFSNGLRYVSTEIKEQRPTHLVLVPLFLEKIHAKIWAGAQKQGKDKTLRRMIKVSNVLRKAGIDLRRKLFASVLASLGGKLEMVISGGAPLKQEIIETFDGIGVTILNGYGITECSPLVTCNRNKLQKAGSVGVPIIDEQIKIVDANENGEGEICVKGPNVMLGYYKNDEATRAVLDEDGFFHTGDLGRIDQDGWLYITGRLKNLIILSNGKNVYPEEIEFKLADIPGIQEVIVYAGESKAKKKEECIVAEIFPDQEWLDAQNVDDALAYFYREVKKVNQHMPTYKTVNHVKLRGEEFSKTTSRKIKRHVIDKSID